MYALITCHVSSHLEFSYDGWVVLFFLWWDLCLVRCLLIGRFASLLKGYGRKGFSSLLTLVYDLTLIGYKF